MNLANKHNHRFEKLNIRVETTSVGINDVERNLNIKLMWFSSGAKSTCTYDFLWSAAYIAKCSSIFALTLALSNNSTQCFQISKIVKLTFFSH